MVNNMKRSSDQTLICVLRILANDIQTDDGVANSALREAADRMEELSGTDYEFNLHDLVSKIGGDYSFDGKVVSRFKKLSGVNRYVVEDDRGVLHVYSSKNLERQC